MTGAVTVADLGIDLADEFARSPARRLPTAAPVSTISPAASSPGVKGKGGLTW